MRNDKESTYDENVILVADSNMKRSDKRNVLLKLHKQFGLASCYTQKSLLIYKSIEYTFLALK